LSLLTKIEQGPWYQAEQTIHAPLKAMAENISETIP